MGFGGGPCGGPPPAPRPGDWNCPTCRDLNFASRSSCRVCSTPKPAGAGGGVFDAGHQAPSGRQTCMFFAREGWCKYGDQCKHLHPAPAGGQQPQQNLQPQPQDPQLMMQQQQQLQQQQLQQQQLQQQQQQHLQPQQLQQQQLQQQQLQAEMQQLDQQRMMQQNQMMPGMPMDWVCAACGSVQSGQSPRCNRCGWERSMSASGGCTGVAGLPPLAPPPPPPLAPPTQGAFNVPLPGAFNMPALADQPPPPLAPPTPGAFNLDVQGAFSAFNLPPVSDNRATPY